MKNKILSFLDKLVYLKKTGVAHYLILMGFVLFAVSFSASAENSIQSQQAKKSVTGIVSNS